MRAADPARTKLRPHRAWARGLRERRARPARRRATSCASRASTTTTRSSAARSAPRRRRSIWRGLQKLEHVAITLGAGRERPADLREPQLHRRAAARPRADPQLRPDGALARGAERDRGRVLGADRAEHRRVDRQLLAALPRDDAPGARWRSRGERGVYDAFRAASSRGWTSRACALTPRNGRSTRRSTACSWTRRTRRTPEIARQLGYVNTFGRGMYPLVMRAYRDHARGAIDAAELLLATARARPVAAAAPHRRGRRHRPARRAAVPRARGRSGRVWSARSAASRPRTSACASR